MAQRVQVILEDDLDGSPATETVSFGLDGVSYEVDLSEEHAAQLRDTFASWIGSACRVGGRRNVKQGKPSGDNGAIRAWALEQGLALSARGRISQEICEAYHAVH